MIVKLLLKHLHRIGWIRIQMCLLHILVSRLDMPYDLHLLRLLIFFLSNIMYYNKNGAFKISLWFGEFRFLFLFVVAT